MSGDALLYPLIAFRFGSNLIATFYFLSLKNILTLRVRLKLNWLVIMTLLSMKTTFMSGNYKLMNLQLAEILEYLRSNLIKKHPIFLRLLISNLIWKVSFGEEQNRNALLIHTIGTSLTIL